MQQRHLGRSGLVVSRLALGTMTWGRDTDTDEAAAQLVAFREAGGTLVETADGYAGGRAEEVLGHLLAGVVPREEVLVAAGSAGGGGRGDLLSSLDATLRRLGVEHVDLWQLRGWDPVTPWEESLAALDAAVASGRVRYAGLSDCAGWQTATAATHQRAWPGRTPLVSTQVEYSLLERGVEREVGPAAAVHGLGLLAWGPLGGGALTGQVAPEAAHRPVVDAVVTAAEGLGVSPVAVSLAWVRDRPGVVAPVVGARTAAQLKGALAAEALVLPAAIRRALDDVSAPEAAAGA